MHEGRPGRRGRGPRDGGLLRGWLDTLLHTYLPRLLVVYGPALAALVLAHLTRRDGGAAGLLRRLAPAGADAILAGGVLVCGAAVGTAALLIADVSPGELRRVVWANAGLLLAHLALQVAVVAVGEELGWRGWLLPRLVERTTRLRATLITAAVWGVWHGALLLSGVNEAVLFLLMVLGLSAVFTWLWSRASGRLFVLVMAHAAVNTPLFFWEQAAGDAGERLRTAWHSLEAIYAAAGVALILARWRWWTGDPRSGD